MDKYHALDLVNDHLVSHWEELDKLYVEELYRDEEIVGDLFSEANDDE